MRFPERYVVSGNEIVENKEDSDRDLSHDPRGVVWIFEPPKQHAHYIMGCDPTIGITGWSRGTRTTDDHKTDNGVLQIFEIGAFSRPVTLNGEPVIDELTKRQKYVSVDRQVAEYAAPIDAVEIARVATILGRIYAGDSEFDHCELIYEAYPGPGILTTQELLRLNYTNLWHWEYIDNIAEDSNRIGWRSTRESQKLLWYRSRRHLMEKRVQIESPWLVEEYANATINLDSMRAKAAYGFHDDRMQAANMCFWAGHKWTYDPDRATPMVTEAREVDWQTHAPVMGEEYGWRDQAEEFFDQ